MKNLFLFLVILAVISCEEKPIEIPDFVAPDTERVVLIEEFSGVRCVNCPNGAREIQNLLGLYDGNLVAVSIHAGFFSNPYPESVYDFQTPEGDALETYIGQVLGYPVASVDRKVFDGNDDPMADRAEWASFIQQQLEQDPELNMSINHKYNEQSRQVEITVSFSPRADIDRDLRLGVIITESGILDYQLDVDGKHSDYEHNHVLRAYLTDIAGNAIGSAPYITGASYSSDLVFTLPEEDGWWVAENCNIVAFIANAEGDTKELIQAAEVHLVE